jgi:hypothetical protein
MARNHNVVFSNVRNEGAGQVQADGYEGAPGPPGVGEPWGCSCNYQITEICARSLLNGGVLSDNFHSMRVQRLLLVVAFLYAATSAAQIITFEKVGEKTISCTHSGLSSNLKDCGARSDWYAYVFIGAISTVNSAEDDEQQVEIVPEEIFSGTPAHLLTVRTSQAACLPKFAVGDRWLFYLRNGNPIVLDYYGNESRPVANAKDEIETLRLLKSIGEPGILRGRVMREDSSGDFLEERAVSGASVTARSSSDNSQFVTTTDTNGHYEFQPLSPGKYYLTVAPIGSFQPDNSEITISSGRCWDLTLVKYPHAKVSGRVRNSSGSPAPQVDVLLSEEDGSWFTSTKTDSRGIFSFDSLRPGRFVVGLNLPGAPKWKYTSAGGPDVTPRASMYFPGAMDRSGAVVIVLAEDEQRKDIDFTLPAR